MKIEFDDYCDFGGVLVVLTTLSIALMILVGTTFSKFNDLAATCRSQCVLTPKENLCKLQE